MIKVYRTNQFKKKNKKHIIRLLWAYCVIKLCERKNFRKDKIVKNKNKKKKISFFKINLSIYMNFQTIKLIKIKLFRMFYFSINSKLFQKDFFIFWSNYIYQKNNFLIRIVFHLKIKIKKKRDLSTFTGSKKEILVDKKYLKQKSKLIFYFLLKFFKNHTKFNFFLAIHFFFKLTYTIISFYILIKSLYLIFKLQLEKINFIDYNLFPYTLDFFNIIYDNLNTSKKILKNQKNRFLKIRLLKDKIDNLFFLFREKIILINKKKKNIFTKKKYKKTNQCCRFELIVYQYLNFIILIYGYQDFAYNLSNIIILNKKYFFIFKLRKYFEIYFLKNILIFIVSLSTFLKNK